MECEFPYCPACDEDRKRELTEALDAAQDEIERLLSEIAAVRIERDNRDAALTAVLKVHQRDRQAVAYCECGYPYPCVTVKAVAIGGAS